MPARARPAFLAAAPDLDLDRGLSWASQRSTFDKVRLVVLRTHEVTDARDARRRKRIDRLEDQSDEQAKDLRDIDREVAELTGEVKALRIGIASHERLDAQRHEEVKTGIGRVEKAIADMRDASGSTAAKDIGWKELGLLLGGIAAALAGGVAAYQQMQQARGAAPAISPPDPSVGGGTGAANPARSVHLDDNSFTITRLGSGRSSDSAHAPPAPVHNAPAAWPTTCAGILCTDWG